MYLLFESPAGYALFQCDESKASTPDAINSLFSGGMAIKAKKPSISLKAFSKFESTSEALADTTLLVEGSMPDSLRKFLKKEIKKDNSTSLGVTDTKLAKAIAKKLEIPIVSDLSVVNEWTRGARSLLPELLSSTTTSSTSIDILGTMALGLAHSLSRYKLKFSSDRVDSMVIQAIALLDDLDKELNTYAMRLREWYGWHFPELTFVLTDSLAYAKLIKAIGRRDQISTFDLSTLLPEDLEKQIKALASMSMGTDLTDADLDNITRLADQVISLSEYRSELSEYLRSRMQAIAPNTTALLGELVGARLVAHSGSLMGLAKAPASTLQLLGAEKALFRALKTKSPTPKYGLLFHTSLVGQAAPKTKGKIARVLAAKAALAVRIDALSRDEDSASSTFAFADGSFGQASRMRVEARLRALERSANSTTNFKVPIGSTKKYTFVSSPPSENVPHYDSSTDYLPSIKRKLVEEVPEEKNMSEVSNQKKEKKSKDKKDEKPPKKEEKDEKKGKKKEKK